MPHDRSGQPVLCVVGARPNFMKIAPVLKAMKLARTPVPALLLHTGQHYDPQMNRQFFEALDIPDPDINLEVGSGSHAFQTAEIMRRFEPILDREAPAAVMVVGDVNSTIACALVAAKKNVPVIHVEAGLRSYDRGMPEEVNRVLTDQISEILFTTERSAHDNLAREGIAETRIRFVGNVMIDSLRAHLTRAVPSGDTLREHGAGSFIAQDRYALLTLHRPSNVDDRATLRALLGAVRDLSERISVVFPVHPRTRANLDRFALNDILRARRVALLPPLGYLEMLGLMKGAAMALTDSGGVQEETTGLGIPCITLRENTERPITVAEGTNTVAGKDPLRILAAADEILRTGGKKGKIPELWDGHASDRIAAALSDWLGCRAQRLVA
jgi:UDP-N-acetylglucosamine 2-epimerase (non-hydrolysing)